MGDAEEESSIGFLAVKSAWDWDSDLGQLGFGIWGLPAGLSEFCLEGLDKSRFSICLFSAYFTKK